MRDVVRGVDDVVREELQEQRKQGEEEEFGEDYSKNTIFDNRVCKKELNTK